MIQSLTHYSALRWLLTLVCFSAGLSHASCIGVVTAGGGIDFWKQVAHGAETAGVDHNVKVLVRGPVNVVDTLSQKIIIEQMLDAGCSGIALAPTSPARIKQAEILSDQGVPVVLIDRNYGKNSLSVVKTNNRNAGVLAAKQMARLVPPGSKIALMRLHQSVISTSEREAGFIEQAEKEGLNVEFDIKLGTDSMEASLRAHTLLETENSIEGIFTPNESTTIAVLNSRKRLNRHTPVKHVGFDAHPSIVNAVRAGELDSVIVQKPYEMGYQAVDLLMTKHDHQSVPQTIETPVMVITKNNLRELSGL